MSYQDFTLQTLISLKNSLKAELKSLLKTAANQTEPEMRAQVKFILWRYIQVIAKLVIRKWCRGSKVQGDLFENGEGDKEK